MKVVPAILTSDKTELVDMLQKSSKATDRVQIDIIDGKFSDNLTVVPEELGFIKTDLLIDFHLMVVDPLDWIDRCAPFADRVIAQIEHMDSQELYLNKLKEVGLKGGFAIDLGTEVSKLNKKVFGMMDCMLVMSVPAGFGGQEFDPLAIKKIAALNEIRKKGGYVFSIIDDGGITLENVGMTKRAGVDEVSVGKRLFEGDLKKNIETFAKQSYDK